MKISKIINWCIKNNYQFTIQECVNDNQRIELSFTDYNIYSAVYNTAKKLRNTHIETKTGCIYIYDIEGYNDIVDYNNKKLKLHDIFWHEKKAGCSSEDAKNKQYQYAIENSMIDIYNKIYA